MSQSSALRKEDTAPHSTRITITYQNGAYNHAPWIDNDGNVTFDAAQPCDVHTTPTGVFGDKDGILKLHQGENGPFYPQQSDKTVNYSITDPQTPRPTMGKVGNGGGTIKVGN
jgi:hypothetical protein